MKNNLKFFYIVFNIITYIILLIILAIINVISDGTFNDSDYLIMGLNIILLLFIINIILSIFCFKKKHKKF